MPSFQNPRQQIQPQSRLFSRKYLNRLILPLVAEQFLAMTIGACDTIMVSSAGEAAVSGVSLIDQFSQLMIQLFSAFATGGAVVASQYLGHKEFDSARKAAKQLLNISIIVSSLLIALCIPLSRQILMILYSKAEGDVLQNALTYFIWILISFPFLAVYNSCAALFRSMGNSRISLIVSLIANFINIGVNAVLIYGFSLGVTGAGIGTLASRGAGALIMVILLCGKKKNVIYFDRIWKFEWSAEMIKRILKIGIPSGIENSVFHIGKIFVQSFMSGFGTVAIAANAITNTVASFANIPGNAIGLASITIVGQCIGAEKKDQAISYGRGFIKEAYIAMAVCSAFIFAFAPVIISVFNLSLEAASLASGVIRTCMCANTIFWPMAFVMPNILRAAGDSKFTMIVSNISMWLFRVLFSYIISSLILLKSPENTNLALYGVWFGMYIDWIFRGLMFGLRFKSKKWLEKKVI